MTAPTGMGKTAIALFAMLVALGRNLGKREVVKGRVLFLAGENPDDVRMRWIKLCEDFGLDPSDVDVCFMDGSYKLSQIREQLETESAIHGPFVLVIVDTSIAYSDSEDENDNVQIGTRTAAQPDGAARWTDDPRNLPPAEACDRPGRLPAPWWGCLRQ